AGVQIYTAVELESPVVVGDPGALSESLWDLASHAIEATGRGGRIEMRLDRNERYARLAITDGRHARDPAEPTVAAPGARVAAMDPLAVRSAIERQGGRFTLELPTRDHGMRFIVEVPFGAVTAPTRPEPSAAGADADTGERRLDGVAVMVVDD